MVKPKANRQRSAPKQTAEAEPREDHTEPKTKPKNKTPQATAQRKTTQRNTPKIKERIL